MFSHVQLFPTFWTVSHQDVHGISQAGILEQVVISYQGDLPDPEIDPPSLVSPALAGGSFTTMLPGIPIFFHFQFSHLVMSDSFGPKDCVAHQASLSIINSWSLLKLMSNESVMPSNHLILCHPLLLLPTIFPSIGVFSNELVLHNRQPKYWSFIFSISPSNEYSGLISFKID